jgi:protein-S-isoprenylcysteine O-methyltransferase Ste14
MMMYGILFFSWLAYYGLHSLLAYPRVKSLMTAWLGTYYRFYRLAFNILSMLLLIVLIGVKFWLPVELFLPEPLWVKILGAVLSLFGSYVLIDAFLTVNLPEFLGLNQLRRGGQPASQSSTKSLIRKGWYAYVRHPFYFGVILILSGVVLLLPSYAVLMLLLATLVYLPFGIMLEEKKLVAEFGDEYRRYQKEVKALIPFIF